MEDKFLQTRQDILELTEILLHTKKELDGVPFFTRKKVYKHLESLLDMDLDELTVMLLEVRSLLAAMAEKMDQKRFVELDRKLLTLKYQYLDRMDVLIRLSAYYGEICPPLLRFIEKKGLQEETQSKYEMRKAFAVRVYEQLHVIYENMNIDEF